MGMNFDFTGSHKMIDVDEMVRKLPGIVRATPIPDGFRGKKAERVPTIIAGGHIRVYRADTKEILYEEENIIVNVVSYLFVRMMANTLPTAGSVNAGPIPLGNLGANNTPVGDALYGVWGLALGTGLPSWSQDTQPVETATQTA